MGIDFLIDKQELIRNKVLKVNGLYGSDIRDVSLRRQLKGKIFGFRKISEPSVAWFDISSLAVLAKKNSPISHASLETTVAFSQSNDVF